ncbi:MAG TPA: hypothetical protein VM802_04675, partial [Chitinophaga sp.]|uniref:hypothetical protein n=1 Tax=Chitinophaga sp. TaxID=1869181 RepID=UPI002CBAAD72
ELRAIKGLRFWQMWFPIKTSIGRYSGTLNNINAVFVDDEQPKTNQHKLWFASTVIRSYADYNGMASVIGTGQAPSGLRILLTTLSAPGAGSTPMNRHRTNAGAMPQSFIEYFIAQPGLSSLSQLFNYLYNSKLLAGVDISLSYHVPNWASSDAREVIYHELTHAAHFNRVGQVWWNTFVYAEAAETARFGSGGQNSPYGDGTAGDISNYIALAESWAYHMGHFMTDMTYGYNTVAVSFARRAYYNNSPVVGLSAHLNALEDYDPRRLDYPFQWIPSGLYYDLLDNRADLQYVTDNVNGYTNQQMFAALQSDVSSIIQFRDRLLLNNGNNQQSQVKTLFTSYGY